MSVTVIIPTLNGEKYIDSLIKALQMQSIVPDEIIVIDSSSEDKTAELALAAGAKLLVIDRCDFDHGKTRNDGLISSSSEYVLFMTQDALPCDSFLIERMLKAFSDNRVAAVYARQIARDDAKEYEKLVRLFNYPEKGMIKTFDDIETLGIKAYFSSDACAMYRRDVFIQLGGFEAGLKASEDMFISAKLLSNGYALSYEAEACVYHSHNYSFKEQFERYKKIGYELYRHKYMLGLTATQRDGLKLFKFVSSHLLKQGKIFSCFAFVIDCIARYIGNKAGIKIAKKGGSI